MNNSQLIKEFSVRLREAMLAQGHQSQRSTSGVCIHTLAEITGYSLQICRKYLRGEAMPEPAKVMELALKLEVSPGWLLFGDANNDPSLTKHSITVKKNLLHYLFTQAACLYTNPKMQQEAPNFLMGLIKEVSKINVSEEHSIGIIDLAFSSLRHFGQADSAEA